MKNTKMQFLYRDASNYKTWNEVIVKGEISDEQIQRIVSSLEEGLYFIPEQLSLPIERFDYLTSDDHCYCELSADDFSLTSDSCTLDMDVNELVASFEKAAKDGWDCITYAVEI